MARSSSRSEPRSRLGPANARPQTWCGQGGSAAHGERGFRDRAGRSAERSGVYAVRRAHPPPVAPAHGRRPRRRTRPWCRRRSAPAASEDLELAAQRDALRAPGRAAPRVTIHKNRRTFLTASSRRQRSKVEGWITIARPAARHAFRLRGRASVRTRKRSSASPGLVAPLPQGALQAAGCVAWPGSQGPSTSSRLLGDRTA